MRFEHLHKVKLLTAKVKSLNVSETLQVSIELAQELHYVLRIVLGKLAVGGMNRQIRAQQNDSLRGTGFLQKGKKLKVSIYDIH